MAGKRVVAVKDVHTAAGSLRVARGTHGIAQRKVYPGRAEQFGRVPVKWAGAKRLVWVDPDTLERHDGGPVQELAVHQAADHPVTWVPACDDVQYNFGFNLRSIRRARGLSQIQLAQQMGDGFSQTTVSNWERSSSGPGGDFVVAAARVLQVPAYVFYLPIECGEMKGELDRFRTLATLVCGG